MLHRERAPGVTGPARSRRLGVVRVGIRRRRLVAGSLRLLLLLRVVLAGKFGARRLGGDDLGEREHLRKLARDAAQAVALLQEVGAGDDDGLDLGGLRLVRRDHVRVVQDVRRQTQQPVAHHRRELRAPHLELVEQRVRVVLQKHGVVLLLRRGFRRLRARLRRRVREPGPRDFPLRAREIEALLDRALILARARLEPAFEPRLVRRVHAHGERLERVVVFQRDGTLQVALGEQNLSAGGDGANGLERHAVRVARAVRLAVVDVVRRVARFPQQRI